VNPFARAAPAPSSARYFELPHEPGGPAPASDARLSALFASMSGRLAEAMAGGERRGFACADADCGGPVYCVHHWLRPVQLETAAAAVTYASAAPFDARLDDVTRGAAVVASLLEANVSPATLHRCGADVGRLSALGHTLESLGARYDLEDLIDGLRLATPAALVALRFSPFLWRNRERFPLVLFTERMGVRAAALACYKLSYRSLVTGFGLSVDELVLLEYDAPTLAAAFEMRAEHVAAAVAEAEAAGYDAAWFYAAFRWTGPLFDTLCAPSVRAQLAGVHRDAYARFIDTVAVQRCVDAGQ